MIPPDNAELVAKVEVAETRNVIMNIYIFFCDDTKVHLTETSHCRYTLLLGIIRPVSIHCKDDHNILHMYDCDNRRMRGGKLSEPNSKGRGTDTTKTVLIIIIII